MNKILYLVAILAISLTSCDKNEQTSLMSEANNESGSVKIVTLEDQSELMEITKELENGKSPSEITQLKNFSSMWDVYQEIVRSSEEKQLEMIKNNPNVVRLKDDGIELVVKDPCLAKVLNPEGFIKIGTKIIKVEEFVVKAITNGDEKQMANLAKINSSTSDGTILVEKIIDIYPSASSEKLSGVQKSKMDDTWNGIDYKVGDSKKRVKWSKWARWYTLLYTSIGGDFSYEEKGIFGIWFEKVRPLYLTVHLGYAEIDRGGGTFKAVWEWTDYDSTNSSYLCVARHYSGTDPVTYISDLWIQYSANGIANQR